MRNVYPLAVLDLPMEERVQNCVRDYVIQLFPRFEVRHGGELAHAKYREWFLASLGRVKNRLGGERYQRVDSQLQEALKEFQQTGDTLGFCKPLETLLRDYYDPMYEYALSKRQGKVIFRGNTQEMLEWAQNYAVAVPDYVVTKSSAR